MVLTARTAADEWCVRLVTVGEFTDAITSHGPARARSVKGSKAAGPQQRASSP